MLDDYQDCGTRPVDVKAMNLDFYVTGTLKYLLGPPGLAFMYVRKELVSSLVPTLTGWFAQLIHLPTILKRSISRRLRADLNQVLRRCPMFMPQYPDSNCCEKSVWRMWPITSGNSLNRCSAMPSIWAFAPKRPRIVPGP